MGITIQTKKEGAELTSIKFNEKEMLHQGKEYWNRHAPILFPIVGQIKNGQTIINDEIYYMGQHGFARDMEFKELEKTENKHSYVLKSNEETLKRFPFEFSLYVTYKIKENELTTEYRVVNEDNKEMLFGLGGHPAFICDYSSEKYEIEFEQPETKIEFMQLENGLISNKKVKNLVQNNKILLEKDIFLNDAIIMKNITSNKVYLREKETKKTILTFDFTGFPYLALWSKVGAPFVCIEPWMNTADKVDSNEEFSSKENIIKLQTKKEFACKYKIKF